MDKKAAIPVTLPPPNPTLPFWQASPSPLASHRTTPDLPASASVVIIGSGITGASVAWNLLSSSPPTPKPTPTPTPTPTSTPPSVPLLMLEARTTCSGATGRNGGHTKAASYRFFPSHAAALGAPAAAQIARLELATLRATHAFAAAHALPCASAPSPTLDVFYDAAQWALAQQGVRALQAALPAGDPAGAYTLYSAEEVRAFRCGGEGVQGGVGYEAGSLAAYDFVTGLLGLCLARGLHLHTHTAAVGLARRPEGGWEVRTARGSVRAERVVLATNAYTAAVVPGLQGRIVPLRGQVAMLRAGGGMPPPAEGLGRTYCFVHEGGEYEYMISRPPGSTCAGDLVMGGGSQVMEDGGLGQYGTTDDTVLDPAISAYLAETGPRFFGDNWGQDDAAGRVRHEWTGIMGFTADGRPLVGEVPDEPGLWISAGFVGHGMVYCWMCSKALVEMMQGKDGHELRSWFPDSFRISKERLQLKFSGRPHHSEATTDDGSSEDV